jgi:hypothetical protein
MADVIGSPFEDVFFPSSPPQGEALIWLADEYPAHLPVDADPTMLLERYTTVHFYFAMKGALWMDQTWWLSEDPVCSWKGLYSTNQGFLASMYHGTCLLLAFFAYEARQLAQLVNMH